MKTRILLVEDDTRLADLTAEYLRKNDFEVTVESRGDTAEARILHDNPALVILDVMLPAQSGLEVLAALRAEPSLAATPVLMLTARGTAGRGAIAPVGADRVMPKPFDNDDLRRVVSEMLGRPQ